VFRTVGGDFSFYQFPSDDYWARLFAESPDSLTFGLKVPENLTVAVWPKHSRYGQRSGQVNEDFMNADVFTRYFAKPLERYRDRVAACMFEFGTFSKSTFATPSDFTAALDPFLARLPKGFRYGVEIRNLDFMGTEYFDTLSRHNVAHVFNAWTRMPELSRQIGWPGAFTADFSLTRALLSHGTTYEESVDAYEPYDKTHVVNESARESLKTIAKRGIEKHEPTFVFINNRLEGNAPNTIAAVADTLLSLGSPPV
jgi:uncharacterized protein YecE (DUF72 family)